MPNDSGGQADAVSVTMADVLALPDDQRELVRWMMRKGRIGLDGLTSEFTGQAATLPTVLQTLIAKGFVQVVDEGGIPGYEVRITSRSARRTQPDIWKALDD